MVVALGKGGHGIRKASAGSAPLWREDSAAPPPPARRYRVVGFDNLELTVDDRVEQMRVHIDANDFDFPRRTHGNVTEPDDGNPAKGERSLHARPRSVKLV